MHGEPEGGGGGGGRGRRAVGAAVGRRQLHPRQRLHHAAPRLPAGAVAQEAPPPPPRRLPARARLQGPLQRHRRGQGGDRGDGGGARGDGGGDGEPARRLHARRRPPRQELPLQVNHEFVFRLSLVNSEHASSIQNPLLD
uniref:Uncharacterized protein n=1 Tax=Zea mays TaxID=4577 RepID=B7ZXN9_MAIZE|nr:unknown [Zea mays]